MPETPVQRPSTAAVSAAGPPPPTEMSRGEQLDAYRDMLLVRRFEEKAGQLYGLGLIGGFCHLYIGQEAVVTGLKRAMGPGDRVITGYRAHGHMLMCGMDAGRIMAEMLGRTSGYSGGKGGSMHMMAPDKGFFGGHGMIGAPVPVGTGLAFAARYRGERTVTWCYMGDGAADRGQVYEAMGLAARFALAIVFVIENNRYLTCADVVKGDAATGLAQRGRPFDIPGWQVDGMDVAAVASAGRAAATWVGDGHGPFILEMATCRYRGHSMSQPDKYQARDGDAASAQSHDPLQRLRDALLAGGVTMDDLKLVDRDVRGIVNAAAAFAQDDTEPQAGGTTSMR
ncbi:MAG: thiamine pyrophosphate-dependent enzyme [Hyphomicrobiaceae bacterium]